MSQISPVAFYLFAGMALAFSVLTVLKKNPVASAFSLVLVFFSFAGIYALLGAHLVATLQILVYAGAIMVLFVFVVMLLNSDTPTFDLRRTPPLFRVAAALVSFSLLALFVKVFREVTITARPGPFTSAAVEAAGGNTQVISELMFSEYILPFELTSVLLLAGIVGSVALAKRHAFLAKSEPKNGG
ncbi:NADH-quinone oxidoreductase subunit J, partial [bacterium]|nr:NADH-quinone oxidoreductase subunit J [bacterium]